MEFFDDPSEIDDRFYDLKNHIDSADWVEVEAESDMYIRVIKSKLRSISNAEFNVLAECNSVRDVSDFQRYSIVSGIEYFAQCLIALFSIKNTLFGNDCSEKESKQKLQNNVDVLHRNLKEGMLTIEAPEIWFAKKIKSNLRKGQKAFRGLVSLRAFLIEILKEKGPDIKLSEIFKRLRAYRDDKPYRYKNFELKYDPENNKLYQLDVNTGVDRPLSIKKVYEYLKQIREKKM